MTNYERIINMSIRELSEFLWSEMTDCEFCIKRLENELDRNMCKRNTMCGVCKSNVLKYLESES